MKSTKLMTSAAIAVLGLTLLAPSVLAADHSLTGNADITYKKDVTPNPPTDPEIPTDPVDPPGVIDPVGGDLTIDFVGNLHFGEQQITTNKGEYFANEARTKNGKGEDIVRGNWVQVTDKRGVSETTGLPLGWEVRAELTQQFTSGSSILKGATLTYSNPVVTSADNVSGTIDGINAETGVVLEYKDGGGASEKMFSADKDKGFGKYFVQYGREAGFGNVTEDDKTSDESIKLTVPANTPLSESTYNAKITWTIAEL